MACMAPGFLMRSAFDEKMRSLTELDEPEMLEEFLCSKKCFESSTSHYCLLRLEPLLAGLVERSSQAQMNFNYVRKGET